MKKGSVTKWVLASIGFTAVAAFTAGVIYQIRAIKKLSVDIDEEDPNEVGDEDVTQEAVEQAAEDTTAETTEA